MTGSNLEDAEEVRTLAFCVLQLQQGCNVQDEAVTSPEVTSFHRKLPGSGCRRPKTVVLYTFELLQGCNSQEVAVT